MNTNCSNCRHWQSFFGRKDMGQCGMLAKSIRHNRSRIAEITGAASR